MDLDTWAQIAVLMGTAATICGVVLHAIGNLKSDMGKLSVKLDATRDELRSEFHTNIAQLRSESKTDTDNLTTLLLRLDERVYDLATGSRQRPLIVPPH